MASLTATTVESLLATSTSTDKGRCLQIDDSWAQGRSWFGGAQMGLALQTIRDQIGASVPLRNLNSSFVAPLDPDQPAIAVASILRSGRSVTQARCSLIQGEQIGFECIATFGGSRESVLQFDSNVHRPLDLPDDQQFPFLPGVTPNYHQYYEMRWVRGEPPFVGARDPGAIILARLAEPTFAYTEAEFLAIADTVPPPVLSLLERPAPLSSMTCSLEMISPEAVYGTNQWIRFESELHDAHSGYAWQTVRMYAESGVLLAICHQSIAVFG